MTSLLNLTADLRATTEKGGMTLKGIAADLNFEGYKIEYADVKNPNVWNSVVPPSDVPVLSDLFTTWVPPYEGIFYVRLTVWDKAGNVAQDQKRVSWGLAASITNLYKSAEIISPNGDGIKDTVEVHYRVLEPVHLAFDIQDENGNLIRTFTKDHVSPVEDVITWDGRDESGRMVADGKYRIKVFDYEFSVEVDNTPPDVGISLTSIQQRLLNETAGILYAKLVGHAVDSRLKRWVIEYGEGDNPKDWYEFLKGEDLIIGKDAKGDPVLNPIKDDTIAKFESQEIEWLVGKKLKVTAEDFAGNRSSAVSNFLEEITLLDKWDGEEIRLARDEDVPGKFKLATTPAYLFRPGVHSIRGLETIRLPIVSLNVQYWGGQDWLDTALVNTPSLGMIEIDWDNSALNLQEGYRVRLKAVDVLGQEHYSNELLMGSLFGLYLNCQNKPPVEAKNYLFAELKLMKFEAQIPQGAGYSQWVEYLVLDPQRGDSIPVGKFIPPLPPSQFGSNYRIRMTGIDIKGEVYESIIDYPPFCLQIAMEVRYEEADCGLTSGKAMMKAEIMGLNDRISLKTLKYYMQKPEGSQLLRQLDLTRGEWGTVDVDTSQMPEGRYGVEASLTYLDLNDNIIKEATAEANLVVDRVLPTGQITYPGKSLKICPITLPGANGNWPGIAVEGIARDNNQVARYELYYGIGEDPVQWQSASTQVRGGQKAIEGKGPVEGQVGIWDMSKIKGSAFSLKLKVVDKSGNVACSTTNFAVDNGAEITALITDKILFSPNDDGVLDDLNLSYAIGEYAKVDVKVFRLLKKGEDSYALDSMPVRTIEAGSSYLGGTENRSWDGRGDSATVLPDGLYAVAVSAKDSCGNVNTRWSPVEVDNTAPVAIISYPGPSDPLGNIVEVKGTADDLNFQGYTLEVGQGDNPNQWLPISSGSTPIKSNVLGDWNTFGLGGRWTLRLVATDAGGNKSTTTVVLDLGVRKNLIKDLTATPRLFSPNNDGKLDTVRIDYELADSCNGAIEISDANGASKRIYTTATLPAGKYSYTWDGRDNNGAMVPDGSYTIKFTAALSSNPAVIQEETIIVGVDCTAPAVGLRQPVSNSYFNGDPVISGTIGDPNILEYFISYAGDRGTVLIDKANQNRENYTFGILTGLAEGNYTLTVRAKDLGENITETVNPFTIDRTPPKATLDTPKEAEYYGAAKNIIHITGTIVEKNLEIFNLKYGVGDNPTQWTDLLSGNVVPSHPHLFSWKVGKNDGVADGSYTLSLRAKDKAGSADEAKIRITIDNTPPDAFISSPKDGDYVKSAVEIRGTASDPNLDKYTLEVSEGQCGGAFKWAAIKTASISVKDGLLAKWQGLPPDGDYCLRMTAVDKVGNSAEAKVNVRVDTNAPAAPMLSGKMETKSSGRLTWTQSAERDFAGYNLYRDAQKVSPTLLKDVQYLDQNLKNGKYTYTVTALDFAGNESKPSNEVRLTADLTGPEAKIRSPQEGTKVGGLVDIKGTAYSSDDFKQYKVWIGQGSIPPAWTLIRTSPVPIAYDSLARWDTFSLAEGSYTIKLEAEDLTGNISTHQIVVTIDNTPPAKPVLLSANAQVADVTLTWQANTEADLAGYLLYRNNQLANVPGIVIGNLKPYLIKGTTYVDKGLPDGKFTYYLVAMDQAQNMSDLSNSLDVDIDRAPRASIVYPADQEKFQSITPLTRHSRNQTGLFFHANGL
jgi:flagellar hook assembly protein FlgD/fibronectin type 3 domain-containing protein